MRLEVGLLRLDSPADKEQALADCAGIAHDLPDYFTDVGVRTLVHDAQSQDLYVESQDGQIVAFAVVGTKSEPVRELLWMAVRRDRQGCGIGSALLAGVEQELRASGAQLLEVKTLAAAAGYAPYEKTRRFYERAGFMLLDTVHPYPGWDEESPCAIYVKAL